MAIDAIDSGRTPIAALKNLQPLPAATEVQRNADSDGAPSSEAAVTDVRVGEQQNLGAIRRGLSEVFAIGTVALAGAEAASGTLDEIGRRLQELTDPAVDDGRRAVLAGEVEALVGQGLEAIEGAGFNGVNLLDAERDEDVETAADAVGNTVALRDQNLQTALQNLQGLDLVSADAANSALEGAFADARTATDTAVEELTTDLAAIVERGGAIRELQSVSAAGRDEGIDTGLTPETAQQTAAQVQQALSGQTLGILNQSPQTLIGLFR